MDKSLSRDLLALASTLNGVPEFATVSAPAKRKNLGPVELNNVLSAFLRPTYPDRQTFPISQQENQMPRASCRQEKPESPHQMLVTESKSFEPESLPSESEVEDEEELDEEDDEEEGRRMEDDGVATVRFYKSLVSKGKFNKMSTTTWSLPTEGHPPTMPKISGAGISEKQHHVALDERKPERVACAPCDPDYRKHDDTPLSSMPLNVIFATAKTGFEEVKEFPLDEGSLIAGRYQVLHVLGEAAFSRAVKCLDLERPLRPEAEHDPNMDAEDLYESVCVKVINSGKEFFDQALDEVKILHMLQQHCDTELKHVVTLYDFFYFREHIFLVCELLSDNLYEYATYNREHMSGPEDFYFTLPRMQSIALQILTALEYVHSLDLVHCDLKPENIMFRSHSRCEIKVIDFGSSAFLTDRLSGYIQSRSYRAPEVIFGADYDGRIDVWSLGAILVELITGEVLFHSDTVPEMLARITAILGEPYPQEALKRGRHTSAYVDQHGAFYELAPTEDGNDECMTYHYPLGTTPDGQDGDSTPVPGHSLEDKIEGAMDGDLAHPALVDLIKRCLTLDYKQRPTAADLLKHPFFDLSF